MNGSTQSAVWQLITQADLVSILVLLGLFFLSVACGAVIIATFFSLRKQHKSLTTLCDSLVDVRSFEDFLLLGKQFHSTIAGNFIVRSVTGIKELVTHASVEQGQHGQLGKLDKD